MVDCLRKTTKMEIHNAAPLYKTKVVYPEPAYFFLMKEIQKKNKGGI
jgi:hypothetical protein